MLGPAVRWTPQGRADDRGSPRGREHDTPARCRRPCSCCSARPATWPSAWCCRRSTSSPSSGLLPEEWRLVGNGRGDVSHEDFRRPVHDVLDGVRPAARRGPWEEFRDAAALRRRRLRSRRPGQPARRPRRGPRASSATTPQLVHYLAVPPVGVRAADQGAGAARPGQGRPGRLREAVRHLAGALPRARRAGALGAGRGAGLPDRPLPRQGGDAGPARAALRQRAVRAASGTASTSSRCRSTCPRRSTSPTAPASTTRPARCSTCSSPTCSRSPPRWRWNRRPASARGPAGGPRVGDRRVPPARSAEVVLGQFDGYRRRDGVAEDSTTDTFVAARLWVDTDRWRGVPFLLRTGKRLARSEQLVSLLLHARRPARGTAPPRQRRCRCRCRAAARSTSGWWPRSPARARAGPGRGTTLDLKQVPGGAPLPPYVSLIHDVLTGDRSLFTTSDGLAKAWATVPRCWTPRRRCSPTSRAAGARPPPPSWPARRAGCSATARAEPGRQPTVTAASSTTNDVCSELSSLPVNVTVTVWPARQSRGVQRVTTRRVQVRVRREGGRTRPSVSGVSLSYGDVVVVSAVSTCR